MKVSMKRMTKTGQSEVLEASVRQPDGKAQRAGMKAHVSKPVEINKLVKILEEQISCAKEKKEKEKGIEG